MYNLYKSCSLQFVGHRGYCLRLRLNFICFALTLRQNALIEPRLGVQKTWPVAMIKLIIYARRSTHQQDSSAKFYSSVTRFSLTRTWTLACTLTPYTLGLLRCDCHLPNKARRFTRPTRLLKSLQASEQNIGIQSSVRRI